MPTPGSINFQIFRVIFPEIEENVKHTELFEGDIWLKKTNIGIFVHRLGCHSISPGEKGQCEGLFFIKKDHRP